MLGQKDFAIFDTGVKKIPENIPRDLLLNV